jgi:hypothetical protein
MRRPLLAGTVAILAFGLVLVVAIAVLDGGTQRGSATPPEVSRAPEVPPVPVDPTPAARPAAEPAVRQNVMGRPPPLPAVVIQTSPAPEPPPRDSWEAVDPVGRPSELGAIGPAFMMAMRNEVSGKLARCFDEVVESRNAASGETPRWTRDGNETAWGAPPVLMLELETRAGSVVLVDAPVESQGSAGDGTILCAQRALRGLTLSVPAARAGERYRLRYPLTR